MRRALVLFCLAALVAAPVSAFDDGRDRLGTGRLFTNDYIGDNRDRWRTGSYVYSHVRGFGWSGRLPGSAGDVVEYRLRNEIIAPEDIVTAAPGDRRYAGSLSFGMHTHFERAGTEVSAGADLVVTGPQTGIGDIQTEVHRILGAPLPGVLGNQIPNGFHPTVTLEFGRPYEMSEMVTLRPFAELRAGVETLFRIGGDVTFGSFGRGEVMLRDVVTGHRYRGTRAGMPGFSLLLGGDVAHVEHSVYLPVHDGYVLTDTRPRVRAGVRWQGESSSVFYGLTWLGEEFEAQPEPQVLGSLRVELEF